MPGGGRLSDMRSLAIAVLLLAAACGAKNDRVASPPPSSPTSAPVNTAPTGSLPIDLLRALPDGDLVLGPESIDSVLSMVLAGARGATADELRQALGHDVPATVPGSRSGNDVTVDITATAWLDKQFKPLAEYRRTLESTFRAAPRTVDFQHDPDGARDAINKEVSKNTHGKIDKLLTDSLDPMTRLVLVSATYLKARWAATFSKEQTAPRPFTLANGDKVDVPTMTRRGHYRVATGTGWRAVELPYADGQTAMLVVVPDDLAAYQRTLAASTVADVNAALASTYVDLFMPSFEQRTRKELNDILKGLGARTMFDPDNADFTGIAPRPPDLFVALVQHEAWIKVDEEGTEAAAATAAVMDATSAVIGEPETFAIDRPFLFFITDRPSGAVLFAGRVVDPR